MIPFEIQSYAFTQHAMRELRAHTDNWADARKATAPAGLLGREGHEHMRTMASEMLQRQAHWPFHLAGDSGARLFNHRAWISWRVLALLELPSLTLCELPSLSKDLQALIEVTRADAPTGESLSAETVQDTLVSFLHDPACDHFKGRWLRHALKLTGASEDAVVEERLMQAVAHAFTVLQSLCNQRGEHATASITPRFVACAALFLHLQDCHYTKTVDDWQPFHVQQRSSRATQSTVRLKRYVTSEQLGDDVNTPLTQFPRCCEHLTSTLNPQVHAIATPPVLCWLCGAGFSSKHALFRHTRAAHGDYAEYRKHLFWLAQELGFQPLLPWQKTAHVCEFLFLPVLLHSRQRSHRMVRREKR